MWTGHLDFVFKGELDRGGAQGDASLAEVEGPSADRQAAPTSRPVELIQEALKEREAVGWSMLRDPAVGFAIGVPTKLVTFGTPRIDGGALFYSGGGDDQPVGRHPPWLSDLQDHGWRSIQRITAGASFRARRDNWFVALFRRGETSSYVKVTCHSDRHRSRTEMTVPVDTAGEAPRACSRAMAGSLGMMRTPDPTVRPRPRVDDLPLAPTGFSDQQAARAASQGQARPSPVDHRRLGQDRCAQARDARRRRPARRRGVREGGGRRLHGQGRPPPGLGRGDQRQRAADQLPRRRRPRPRSRSSRAKDELPAKVVSTQRRRRPLRAAHGTAKLAEMGHASGPTTTSRSASAPSPSARRRGSS